MSCSTGLHNAIKKILNKKPWYRYIIQGNNGIIHLLNNSKANINYYTSYDAAVVIAAHINDSINNGEKIIGDIAFPKRDYTKRGIVVIEPLNAQLDLLNTEDSAEISRLQSKIQTESEIKEQEEKSINKEEDANILNNNIETIRGWLKQGMEEDTFWQKVEELGVSKVQINTFKGVSNDLQTKEHSLNLSPKTEKKDSQTPTRNTQNIYSKLGNKTATGNVIIKSVYQQEGIQYAKSIGGVFSLRVNNSNKHFGNPFSSVQSEIDKGLTATKSTKESVEKYIDWVINNFNLEKKNLFTVIPKQAVDKKAIIKASIATQYIGFAEGIAGSSTALYAKQISEQSKKEIKGINISSRSTEKLGKRLTNPNWYAKDLMDVEAPYKANASKIKAPQLNAEEALKYDMNLMYNLQVQKFRKNPELIDEINNAGGLEFIKNSSHIVGVKNSRWEGKGMESNFIKVLAKSYETVAKELNKFQESSIKSDIVNSGNYSSNDVIFVSIGGKRGNPELRKAQQDKTIKEALKAIEAGATLITDNKNYIESSDYNEGEKRLYKNLEAKGYKYSEQTVDGQLLGIWKKDIQSKTTWDSLEDWQKEKLSKLKVTKEIFDVQSEQEKENVLFCLKK